jgi:ABC-type dipeptide/oligopeptide/nickel transport system ATPase component
MSRERALQLLMDGFVLVQASHGQVVVLVGEAGVGKSLPAPGVSSAAGVGGHLA